jgi:5'/3'-nucleotidase SurE
MNKFNKLKVALGQPPGSVKAAVVLAMTASVSACYTPAAYHDYTRDGSVPWWCKGSPDLNQEECAAVSWNLDVGNVLANAYPTVAAVTGAGGVERADRPDNIGVAYTAPYPTGAFNPNAPNVLLYGGSSSTSRLVGVAWEISSDTAPEGFPGDRDVWTQNETTGNWWLTAWTVRGHENHPNVFAAAHPCLTNTGTTLTSTTDACFVASHTEPFEVLVTNDDGYAAGGIDAVVEGLYGLPNVVVNVVAPLANQSGSGDQVTRPGYVVTPSAVTTLSGRPATALSSNDPQRPNGSASPADTVNYGLHTLLLSPELVVSGTNLGQNMGPVVGASGTIGAARTARRTGVPALATSSGGIAPPNDFPTAAAATMALLESWRIGQEVNTVNSVLNINIPTCAPGFSVRGTLHTVVAPDMLGRNYLAQDCSSTVTAINDDVDAFNHGYIGITDVGANKPPNWP